MMHRFIVMQAVLVAGLAALWMEGYLTELMSGGGKWAIMAILAIAAWGLFSIPLGALRHARFARSILTLIGVIAMQSGIVMALAVLAKDATAMGAFIGHIGTALYSSIAALSSTAWLWANLHLVAGDDGEA